MAREIKFRAWDGRTMQHDIGVLPLSGEEKIVASHYTLKYRPDQVQLMQYTGLKDKNSREIYEGDILETRYGHKTVGDIHDLCGDTNVPNESEREVIGNIWENPELLK